jgi:phage terminase small subunit
MTPKQAAFVQFYLVDMNATQAAIKAGYSERSAQVTGSKLLSNPMVRKELERGRTALAEQTNITKESLVSDLHAEFKAALGRQPQAAARLGELLARMLGFIDDNPQPAQQLVNLIIQR